MKLSPEELQRLMSIKSDEDIHRFLLIPSQGYSAETIEAAKGEAEERNLNPSDDLNLRSVAALNDQPETVSIWVKIGMVVCSLWVIYFVSQGFLNGHDYLDQLGWISHDHDTPVWIKDEWLEREYRVCKMPLMPGQSLPSSAHLLCGQSFEQADAWPVDFIGSISDRDFIGLMGFNWVAVEQHFHVLPVSYWGRIDRTGQLMFSWRCQRQASGLECKALN